MLGALPAGLLEPGGRARWWPVAVGAALLALVWAGGMLRLAGAEVAEVDGVRLRLVQGNVPQGDKWRPEMRSYWFSHHLSLSAQPRRRHHPPRLAGISEPLRRSRRSRKRAR